MSTYKVRVERQDRHWWYIAIPELNGATQARHLREVERMARDWINGVTDEDPSTIELDVEIVVPPSARVHLDREAGLRRTASEASAEATMAKRRAIEELRAQGIPLRDIGILLGVSYQRVHALTRAAAD